MPSNVKFKTVCVDLPEDTIERIEDIARTIGEDRQKVLRILITVGLAFMENSREYIN